ncbi:hypothetical protein K3G63_05795 [Hymenobacter sp. HSC-4F20]|uniref:hypothetical protein n=1 Tax=Hymenobacter sp. HSC-4F20 TaxID=2864135 RepID=UPI001C7340AF|nr:hypothetical protein [Hymenobacter sp. HSC-4F20]MBX0289942.1 hypothetical protein [Hymenobacter sp. HSC-4F20]
MSSRTDSRLHSGKATTSGQTMCSLENGPDWQYCPRTTVPFAGGGSLAQYW